jgi:hypothetical protein
MKTKNATATAAHACETPDLDIRYGKIGISAVAAAMRYQRTTRTEPASTERERSKPADLAEAAARRPSL